MSWLEMTSVLGNIGEFIGSIAVLATLVYLALQVNHSKALLEKQGQALDQSINIARSSAEAELFYRNVDYFRSILENPQVAELGVKLQKDVALTETEEQQARAWATQLQQLWISSERYYVKGLIDRQVFEAMLRAPENAMNHYPGLVPFVAGEAHGRGDETEMTRAIRQALATRSIGPQGTHTAVQGPGVSS